MLIQATTVEGASMASLEAFRDIVNERLSAAADEIFTLFRSVVVEYEEELERQRRLVELASKPEDTNETEILQQNVCVEAVGIDPQLMKEESFSLDQHPPEPQLVKDEQGELCISLEEEQLHLKEEANAFTLTLAVEGSDQGEELVETRQDHSEREQEDLGPITEPEPAKPEPAKPARRKVNRQSKNKRKSVSSNTEHHFDAQNDSIKCDSQGKHLGCTSELQISLRNLKGKKLHPCEICGKGFVYKSARDKHVRIHKADKSDLSQRVCSLRLELKRQTTIKKDEKQHSCQTCGKKFVYAYLLKTHLRTHSGEKPFLCKTCGKQFTSKSILKTHSITHTGEKPYSCEKCGKKFTSSSGIKYHRRVHTGEKPFLCKTCGQRFKCEAGLRSHIIRHTGERPFSCDVCGKVFIRSSDLKYHMRVHTGERPYSCDTCRKRFCHSSGLKAHMKIHTRDKPYSCDKCGKKFSLPTALKSHMKVHMGSTMYTCQECDMDFIAKCYLMRHMSIHTGERPYTCETCKKTFRIQNNLNSHIKRMHKAENP